MSVDNTTRPAMELNLDIAGMFYKISSALYYDLDPLATPSTLLLRTRHPGRALGSLAAPLAPCLPPDVRLHPVYSNEESFMV